MRIKLNMIIASLFISASVALLPFTSYARISIPDYLYAHYELSPPCVQQSFANDGWDLECVSGDELNRLYGYGMFASLGYSIAGATVFDLKTIYLSDEEGYAEMSLNHEMGHFLDYSYYTYYGIQPSMTDAFYYIYFHEAQASCLYENYELSNISEYFAQSYWSYVEDGYELMLNYPMTYQYMDEVIKDYEAAVYGGYEPIYDGTVFMTVGHSSASTPVSQKKALSFTDKNRKIDTTEIPLLKELVQKQKSH